MHGNRVFVNSRRRAFEGGFGPFLELGGTSVRFLRHQFLNRPLDTSIVHFFLVSRGRIRISSLRCPEVRLAFQL